MTLTQQQIEHYLKTGGINCPYCGSCNIEGGPVEISTGDSWQNVKCLKCNATWRDIYTLTGVEDD